MESTAIRLLLGGMFLAFIIGEILTDLWRRRPRKKPPPREKGFLRGKRVTDTPESRPRDSWKVRPHLRGGTGFRKIS